MAFNDLHIANSWSVAIWLKPGRDTADETILDLRSDGSNENRIRVEKLGTVSNDPLQITLYDSAGAEFKRYRYESVVPAGEWQLVLFTWNGTTLTAYADGAAVAASSTPTNTTGTMASSLRSVTVGADYAHTAFFQGYVHSVGLWSSVLAADEVTKLYDSPLLWWRQDAGDYVSSANLQHWWRLGEPTRNDFEGTTWVVDAGYAPEGIDLSVGAANVTDADIVAEVPSVVTYLYRSLYFNGTDEALANTTENDLGFGNAWTIAFCLARIVGDMGSATDSFLVIREASGNENCIEIGTAVSGSTTIRISNYDSAGALIKSYNWLTHNDGIGNRWYKFAVKWDGSTLTMSVNGAIAATGSPTADNSGTMTNTNRRIYAMRGFSAGYYSGYLIGPAIWNEALTDAEMNQLTLDMERRDLTVDYGNYASSANLVHYWRPMAASGLESGQNWITDFLGMAGVDLGANAENMSTADWSDEVPYYPAEMGHCLSLDGSTKYIKNGNGNVNWLPGNNSNAFTCKFTVRSGRDSADEVIFEKKAVADSQNRFYVAKLGTQANDPLQIVVYNSVGTITKDYRYNNALPSGQWKSYIFMYDGAPPSGNDLLILYDQDGNVVTPDSTPTDTNSSFLKGDAGELSIGADCAGANLFQGEIRELAFWNNPLTATLIADKSGLTVDLAAATANWEVGFGTSTTSTSQLTMWLLFGYPDWGHVASPSDWIRDASIREADVAQRDWTGSANVSAADILDIIPS